MKMFMKIIDVAALMAGMTTGVMAQEQESSSRCQRLRHARKRLRRG